MCVCLLVQCPEATLTQFQCLRQTDREDSAQLASSEFSLQLVQIFRLLLKISEEGNTPEFTVFLEALLRRSIVCLKSSLFPVLLSVPLVRSSLFLWLVPPCVVVVPQGMAMSSSKDYLKCGE